MQIISTSSLQLEGYFVNEFSFALKPDPSGSELMMGPGLHMQSKKLFFPGPLEVSVNMTGGHHAKNHRRWRVELSISPGDNTDPNFPYDFHIMLVGFFEVSADYPPHLVESMMKITAPSVLYSAAREYIAMATGRGPFPAVVLPMIRFHYPTDVESPTTKQLPAAQVLPSVKRKASRKTAARKAIKKGGK